MSLDYDKIKKKQEEGNQWASYSDLFMVLSFIFLLLYVTSSLRIGTSNIQNHLQFTDMKNKINSLQEELKAYETLKEDYIQNQAKKSEQEEYQDLMKHLDLLQLEAKAEKEELLRQAKENAEKAKSLNRYQRMVKNIVDANMVARARINKRDSVITDKEETIKQKQKVIRTKQQEIAKQRNELSNMSQQISSLEKTVTEKQEMLAQNEEKVVKIKQKLSERIAKLNQEYQKQKVSQRIAQEKIAELKIQSKQEIEKLEGQNKIVERQLSRLTSKLDQANTKIAKVSEDLIKKDEEKKEIEQKFKQELKETEAKYQEKLSEVDNKFNDELKKAQAAYEQALAQKKNSYKKQSRSMRKKYAKELNEAKKTLEGIKSQVAQEKEKLSSEISQAKKALEEVKKEAKAKLKDAKTKHAVELAKERAKANARKRLVSQIKKNFQKAGIKANIDEKSGDVVLSFGDEYFDTGKHSLKPGMVDILQKAVPAYSKSLFENEKLASKISGVEIVGFASPTFRGKYVDPNSLDPKDQAAVSYNLDLSYKRAKSIFTHIFDTKKLKYEHQKKLLGMVKVAGRSFLASKDRNIASGVTKKSCTTKNCKESQRVIIKFNLKN